MDSVDGGGGELAVVPADLFDDVSFLLARANALSLAAGNAALGAGGLRVRSYSVLALAAGGRRPSQRELAELLRLDPSQVVALVDDLQSRGLVIRRPDPSDRRANVVIATEDGRIAYAAAAASVSEAQNNLLGGLSAGERTQLAALLRRLAFPG
ncbi:MAG TPA: MarR family winged helix-turn-helix transcriptional regulator [Microbacterium sp.]|uniref:MarR family winged helix-turn-helix transcriptional regulator n=1 Tax=Microbacterium sp. TaxID=51671 RepID=UPI002C2CFA3C|nr:MarR family winged helix-turn-helix transcriptional regulator [Microbacterium sp.]HWI31980.1 MarR family winged helix-turn-helix transcriptional regulator [Microbacterium sp.]